VAQLLTLRGMPLAALPPYSLPPRGFPSQRSAPRRTSPATPCSRSGMAPASLRRPTPAVLPPPTCLHPAGVEMEGVGGGRSGEAGGETLRSLGAEILGPEAEHWKPLGAAVGFAGCQKLKRKIEKQALGRCPWKN